MPSIIPAMGASASLVTGFFLTVKSQIYPPTEALLLPPGVMHLGANPFFSGLKLASTFSSFQILLSWDSLPTGPLVA